MPKYLFTSDLRISMLSEKIQSTAAWVVAGKRISDIVDKSENNNATTLAFYFNLYEHTVTCDVAALNPIDVIRNHVLKFQFPNTRTRESYNDSINEKTLFAPYRSVVRVLYRMSEHTDNGVGEITLDEILYFLFCNKEIFTNPDFDVDKVIENINRSRRESHDTRSRIAAVIEWNQYSRQVREMMTVLTKAFSCFKLSKNTLVFSKNSPIYLENKKAIDDLLSYHFMWYPSDKDDFNKAEKEYISYMDMKDVAYSVIDYGFTRKAKNRQNQEPLQQIFYGAPGTGKSHKIKEREKLLEKDNVFRTTFHPDSDYASFVGAYKPTMEERPMRVVPVVISEKGTMFEQNQGTYIENKIEYSYVAQSFIKAYVRAWNIWTKDTPITGEKGKIDFKSKNGQYVIDSVDDNNLSYTRQFNYNLGRSKIKTTWNRIWKNGKFEIPQGRRTGASVEEAIATWIYDKLDDCNEGSLQIGLELFRKEIEKGDIAIQGKTQKYMFHRVDDSDEIIITTQNNTKKETVKKYYLSEDEEPTYELHSNIIDILADYDESDFDNAWEQLREDVNNGGKIENDNQDALNNKVLLVIEEINRGNCAQIFGDIFQLLDRGDEGFSDYPIDSDSDIEKYLRKKFEKLEFSAKQRIFINNCFCGQDVASKILEGKKLVLPPNLYIWATMNTSDQSLFPIDSAFKRRWDWKYIPIKEHPDKNYKIEIGEKTYDWWGFLERINKVIGDTTSSEDKKLGYFFVKTETSKVSDEQFVGKVLFYLWNDVFKNYGFDHTIFSKGDKDKFVFSDFFNADGTPSKDNVQLFLKRVEDAIKIDRPLDITPKEETTTVSEEATVAEA